MFKIVSNALVTIVNHISVHEESLYKHNIEHVLQDMQGKQSFSVLFIQYIYTLLVSYFVIFIYPVHGKIINVIVSWLMCIFIQFILLVTQIIYPVRG